MEMEIGKDGKATVAAQIHRQTQVICDQHEERRTWWMADKERLVNDTTSKRLFRVMTIRCYIEALILLMLFLIWLK